MLFFHTHTKKNQKNLVGQRHHGSTCSSQIWSGSGSPSQVVLPGRSVVKVVEVEEKEEEEEEEASLSVVAVEV